MPEPSQVPNPDGLSAPKPPKPVSPLELEISKVVDVPPIEGKGQAEPPRRRRFARWNFKRGLRVTALIILALIVGTGGWLGWKFIHDTSKAFGNSSILGLLGNSKLKGESQGRVNILLAGDSADDPGHGGSNLTDSIMIVSIDTKDNSAFLLSIPRDLWVNIPGHGHQKINAANADSGMPLLEKVLSDKLQIPINYYALVDYTAFKQAVDTVGGIDITIKSADPRGIYDPNISRADDGPLILKNGLQHLNGQTALNLSRARNDPTPSGRIGYGLPGGDFDRAANQRLMLVALKSKATSLGTLANPVKISQLLDTLGNNVHSNLTTSNLKRLYDLTKTINSSSVKSLSLNDPAHNAVLIQNYTASDGEAALIPLAGLDDFSKIQLYLRQLTSNDPIIKESATVEVLNGSGMTGLAQKQSDVLTGKNLNVIGIGNAPATYTTTTIIDNSAGKKPSTAKLLTNTYGSTTATNAALSKQYQADFIVILGTDQVQTQSSPTSGN